MTEEPEPYEMFDEVRGIDDRLGRYADYEGDREGPTSYFWRKGKEAFDLQCERAIEDHQKAVRIWRKLRRVNAKRRVNS